MSKAPAFQFYVQDFLTGTMHLSAEEIGAYILLLCHQWDKGGLPSGDKDLLRIARTKLKVLEVVKEKFEACEDGMLRNQRLEMERGKQQAFRDKQAQNGGKGGRPKGNPKETQINPSLYNGLSQPEAKESSSSSTSFSISDTNVNKKTCVGNQFYSGKPSEILLVLHQAAVESYLMQLFRTLKPEDIYRELDLKYPIGYKFNTEAHLLNCFKKCGEELLNPKSKTNHGANSQRPGGQVLTGDYSRYKKPADS